MQNDQRRTLRRTVPSKAANAASTLRDRRGSSDNHQPGRPKRATIERGFGTRPLRLGLTHSKSKVISPNALATAHISR